MMLDGFPMVSDGTVNLRSWDKIKNTYWCSGGAWKFLLSSPKVPVQKWWFIHGGGQHHQPFMRVHWPKFWWFLQCDELAVIKNVVFVPLSNHDNLGVSYGGHNPCWVGSDFAYSLCLLGWNDYKLGWASRCACKSMQHDHFMPRNLLTSVDLCCRKHQLWDTTKNGWERPRMKWSTQGLPRMLNMFAGLAGPRPCWYGPNLNEVRMTWTSVAQGWTVPTWSIIIWTVNHSCLLVYQLPTLPLLKIIRWVEEIPQKNMQVNINNITRIPTTYVYDVDKALVCFSWEYRSLWKNSDVH